VVSTVNLAVDPFIYTTATERFYITISMNVHTINMEAFSLIDRAEKILHCKAD
jgi:purine-nucleoside phosphorylase